MTTNKSKGAMVGEMSRIRKRNYNVKINVIVAGSLVKETPSQTVPSRTLVVLGP